MKACSINIKWILCVWLIPKDENEKGPLVKQRDGARKFSKQIKIENPAVIVYTRLGEKRISHH